MSIQKELLEILVCPETKQPVSLANSEVLNALNERIRGGEVRNRGGSAIGEEVEEGLVREDGRVLYLVDGGIPLMLIEESIEIS